jgi:pyridoxal phosphate enzyme (YggS family)
MKIAANLGRIIAEIAVTARAAGRAPGAVRLVAVSKTKPAALVDEAARAGQRLFGENYVQELVEKVQQVTEPVEWHFIGHLQSNKVKYIAGLVSMIHAVDRLSLAQEIDRQWGKLGKCCDVLVQVNISGEATKGGTTATDAAELVRAMAQLPHLRVRGLMTMPPFFDDPDGARPYFCQLREIAEHIAQLEIPGVCMDELSMGMSGDFVPAIAEGATLVRIGSAIFGSRT